VASSIKESQKPSAIFVPSLDEDKASAASPSHKSGGQSPGNVSEAEDEDDSNITEEQEESEESSKSESSDSDYQRSIAEMQDKVLRLNGKVKKMKTRMENITTKLMQEVFNAKNFENEVKRDFEKIKPEVLQ
jgi:molecular chaperone GrpE (heat shock protein)